MVLIHDLVAVPELGLTLRYSGSAQREISWLADGRLTDVLLHATEHAFVITHRSSDTDTDPKRWLQAVASLSRRKISALGFRITSTHPELPRALVQAATQYRLPLVEVPEHTTQALVARTLARLRHGDELRQAREALLAQRRVLDLAYGGTGLTGIVAAVASLTGRATALVDASGARIAATASFGKDALKVPSRTQRLAVGSGRELVVEGGTLDPDGFAAFMSAAIVLSVEDRSNTHNTVTERERWGRLTRAILTGAPELHALCALLDPEQDLPNQIHVIVVQGPAETIASWRSEVRTGGQRFITRYPVDKHSSTETIPGIVLAWQVICPELLDEALAHIARFSLDAVVGICTAIDNAPLSRRSAEALLPRLSVTEQLYRTPRTPRLIRAEHTSRVLAHVTGSRERDAFSRHVLGPLSRLAPPSGTPHTGELRETLEVFLSHHGQYSTTAESLGIHRNTLRGRLTRIEALLGRSLDSPDDRAELWIALRAEG